ncbi:MAG: hypothetical protein J6R86_03430, partial [Lentisphaeria bacterium]|nr:hypothetical protein [Lentisphaeria bacterium]
MEQSKLTSGILRPDIELVRGENLMLFDPGADAYFKITPQMLKVISRLTEDLPLQEFQQKLQACGICVSIEELTETVIFLKQNNLTVPQYGETAIRQQQIKILKEKNRLLYIFSSYMFFRLPPWRPENFFQRYRKIFNIFTAKPLLIFLLIFASIGYLLILRELPAVHSAF